MTNVMYIGPPMRGIVRKNQMFTAYPTEVVERAKEVSKLSEHLFIGMDDIIEAKKELKRKDSFLNIAIKQVSKEVTKWATSTTS